MIMKRNKKNKKKNLQDWKKNQKLIKRNQKLLRLKIWDLIKKKALKSKTSKNKVTINRT